MLLLLSHFSHVQLCDPTDGSPPGFPIPGILQVTTLEWVAISFSNAWKWKVKVKSLSRVWPSATPWTAAFQAPPSMGFSRQEYWSGVPLPSPVFLHNWDYTAHSTALFFFNTVLSALSAHHCKSPSHSQWGSSIEHLWYALPLSSPPSYLYHTAFLKGLSWREDRCDCPLSSTEVQWLAPGCWDSRINIRTSVSPIPFSCTTPQEREMAHVKNAKLP